MLAAQVAAPDQVPDDHRSRRVTARSGWGRIVDLIEELGQSEHVMFAYTASRMPVFLRILVL